MREKAWGTARDYPRMLADARVHPNMLEGARIDLKNIDARIIRKSFETLRSYIATLVPTCIRYPRLQKPKFGEFEIAVDQCVVLFIENAHFWM